MDPKEIDRLNNKIEELWDYLFEMQTVSDEFAADVVSELCRHRRVLRRLILKSTQFQITEKQEIEG